MSIYIILFYSKILRDVNLSPMYLSGFSDATNNVVIQPAKCRPIKNLVTKNNRKKSKSKLKQKIRKEPDRRKV